MTNSEEFFLVNHWGTSPRLLALLHAAFLPPTHVWSNAITGRRPRAPPISTNRPRESDRSSLKSLRQQERCSYNGGINPLVRRFYLFLQIHRQESIRPPRPCSQRKAPTCAVAWCRRCRTNPVPKAAKSWVKVTAARFVVI